MRSGKSTTTMLIKLTIKTQERQQRTLKFKIKERISRSRRVWPELRLKMQPKDQLQVVQAIRQLLTLSFRQFSKIRPPLRWEIWWTAEVIWYQLEMLEVSKTWGHYNHLLRAASKEWTIHRHKPKSWTPNSLYLNQARVVWAASLQMRVRFLQLPLKRT